jgi:hypothetical protein
VANDFGKQKRKTPNLFMIIKMRLSWKGPASLLPNLIWMILMLELLFAML